jgi:hypothetical protein
MLVVIRSMRIAIISESRRDDVGRSTRVGPAIETQFQSKRPARDRASSGRRLARAARLRIAGGGIRCSHPTPRDRVSTGRICGMLNGDRLLHDAATDM